MIVVIQCAASKRPGAGHLVERDGKLVDLVAHPEIAPAKSRRVYARPDDISDRGISWREQLWKYNENPKTNPLGLCPAYQLYENKTYSSLVSRFGSKNVYILSAGWGLIRSDFLTPYYDITFSQSADAYKRRRKTDRFEDFRMLSDETTGEMIFLGGKDYLPLFCKLTGRVKAKRIVFFNSASPPRIENCIFKRFETRTQTNWHYECANALLSGRVHL
jgi:hypothetical protein